MKQILLTAFALSLFMPFAAQAEDVTPEHAPMATIKFETPYAFATAESQQNGAVFLAMTNSLGHDDRLLAVTSDVAEKVELHETVMDGDVMQMRPAVDGFALAAGATLTLEPTGSHIMLIGLKAPLATGTPFNVTLDFEKTPDITLPVDVVAPGAAPQTEPAADPHAGHDGAHDHGTAAE